MTDPISSSLPRTHTPQPGDNGRITIDLGALAGNWKALSARLADGTECGAAVKADCYGLGDAPCMSALWQAGCRTFFVATPQEGARLRALLPEAYVYILNGLYPGDADYYAAHELRPCLGSPDEVAEWRAAGAPGPAALHVDTGISRLGLSAGEAAEVAADGLPGLSLVMSHLACADTPNAPSNAGQLARFREIAALFPGVARSLANSAGIFLGPDFHFDLARPGIALYGGQPSNDAASRLAPVVTLEARILQTHALARGETIGYGAAWTAPVDMRVAMVAAGYADGYLRSAGSSDARPGADAWLAGYRLPALGRVSMDMTAFDISALPEGLAERGAFIELFGPNIGVDEVAAAAGTIGYELLTSLGHRFTRRHVGDPTGITR
ncbi:alanine racemase [Stappia sp. MMSF_3263]|uniref:alanine racemase n=1 Tax=Stappia sp. MMSF_3263 TaxID=3046693 RepID=UPI0027402736|nr:alanine racemase [Stappia sp. MMSF_3263]